MSLRPEPYAHASAPASRYRMLAEVGRGAMATVYVAVASGPPPYPKLYALKRPRPDLALDSEFLAMFLEEARLAAHLSHPNVVHTYDVGEDADGYFIAMEYVDGVSLREVITACGYGGAFTFAHMLCVLQEALAGLEHAATRMAFDGARLDLVHRDVSPHNLLIGFDGHTRLVDFGIAKAADSSVETKTGFVKGKVTYMAPEQAMGLELNATADLYSIGVMLWEATAGRRRWPANAGPNVLQALLQQPEPTSPLAAEQGLPAELDAICLRALDPKISRRFQTAAEFSTALDELWKHLPQRISPRDVGALLRETFAEQRKKRRTVIEEQLKILTELAASEERTQLAPVRVPATPPLPPAEPLSAPARPNKLPSPNVKWTATLIVAALLAAAGGYALRGAQSTPSVSATSSCGETRVAASAPSTPLSVAAVASGAAPVHALPEGVPTSKQARPDADHGVARELRRGSGGHAGALAPDFNAALPVAVPNAAAATTTESTLPAPRATLNLQNPFRP